MRIRLSFIPIVVVAAGCENPSVPPNSDPSSRVTIKSAPAVECDTIHTVPYGVRAGRNRPDCVQPELYDAAKHGPPHVNTRPEKNLVLSAPSRIPPRPIVGPSRKRGESVGLRGGGPPLEPGDGDNGWFINTYYLRGNIRNVVHRNFQIPSQIADQAPQGIGTIIYAPTHKLRAACIETVVIYWRLPFAGTTTRQFGWWDFCVTNDWVLVEDMNDPSWGTDYVYPFATAGHATQDHVFVWVDNLTPGCWRGMIYNRTIGQLEEKVNVCGIPSDERGWSLWESYYLMDSFSDPVQCPFIPHMDASVYLHTTQASTPQGQFALSQAGITALTPSGLCWTSGTYWMRFYPGYPDQWESFTPVF